MLTSSECLNVLEEKEKKKELEAEEKRKKKKIREEKRTERKLLLLKKREDREKKKEIREKKKEELQRKKRDEQEKKQLEALARKSVRRGRPSKPVSADQAPPCMSASTSQQPNFDEDNTCAFCYEQFGSDDLEWVECSCGRWVHALKTSSLMMMGRKSFVHFVLTN